MTRQERYDGILGYFRTERPVAETELEYGNPYELLVAVILSAQCTDKRVNLTTPAFFSAFPDIYSLAAANDREVFPFIKSISYPNNKAKHLVGMARKLVSSFHGKLPSSVEDLMELPGVGRKTANVIASVVFNIPAIAVDTHVFRVAARTGMTSGAKTPAQAEKQLVKFIPEEELAIAHHWFILHGRYICLARSPRCEICGIQRWCKYYKNVFVKKKYKKASGKDSR